jgi:hypothetical protein
MKRILIVAAVAIAFLASCTDSQKSRVDIPEGRVLVSCSWKKDNLWVLTKDTTTGEMFFSEKTNYSILKGEINFK